MSKFEIVVRAIITDKKGKILLVKRAKTPEKDKWCLPGGKVEYAETVDDAIKREIKEELNLTFYPKFIQYKDDTISVPSVHCLVLYFAGKYEGSIKMKKDEIGDYTFFSKNEVKKSTDIGFDHMEILLRYR